MRKARACKQSVGQPHRSLASWATQAAGPTHHARQPQLCFGSVLSACPPSEKRHARPALQQQQYQEAQHGCPTVRVFCARREPACGRAGSGQAACLTPAMGAGTGAACKCGVWGGGWGVARGSAIDRGHPADPAGSRAVHERRGISPKASCRAPFIMGTRDA